MHVAIRISRKTPLTSDSLYTSLVRNENITFIFTTGTNQSIGRNYPLFLHSLAGGREIGSSFIPHVGMVAQAQQTLLIGEHHCAKIRERYETHITTRYPLRTLRDQPRFETYVASSDLIGFDFSQSMYFFHSAT